MLRRSMYLQVIVPLFIAIVTLTAPAFFSSAASYRRTSLQEMTQRAVAVAEVRVLSRTYPPMPESEFQRTNVEVSVLKTLKGSLPDKLTLDLPGGLRANQVFFVADSAEFQIGEHAMIFIKEPSPGNYMVQDLGLGKFNVVQRGDKTVVESALCPKAMAATAGTAEADLLTKAIPYDAFCLLISSYAANAKPAVDSVKLALTLPNSGSHTCEPGNACSAAMDAALISDATRQQHEILSLALCAVFMAACAGMVVYVHRKNAKKIPVKSSLKSVTLILSTSLVAGAALGGSYSLAFNTSGQIWNLDDTSTPSKIQNGKIVWYQSVQGSKTNSNCFTDVQTSFNKWASVTNSRLGFVAAGVTMNTVHSGSDNQNFVVWSSNPGSDFSAATLGITYSIFTVGTPSFFTDCDIVFNDRDFNWAPGGTGDTLSVSLHEIGHFVGLAHTADITTVMFPIDQGLLQLSGDEISAIQKLYPGTSGSDSPPPVANISGSPLSGPPPLNCNFDASASRPGLNPIVTYAWNFGDGATATGITTTHSYTTPGVYTAILTVTDSASAIGSATVTVTVMGSGTPVKGAFKLNFKATGKDTFSANILSSDFTHFTAGTSTLIGTVQVAGVVYQFTYDPVKHKAVGSNGLKLKVNPKTGLFAIALKNVTLQPALGLLGATNSSTSNGSVKVPVTVVIGDSSLFGINNQFNFTYNSLQNTSGSGKF